jgi:hypothetical protein
MRYAMRSRCADPLQWTWLDNSGLDADRRFTQNMTRIVSRQKRPEITEIVIPYWRARCMEGLREAHPQAIVARPACWD